MYLVKVFFKYVDYTTSRFSHHNVAAHMFILITNIRDNAELEIVNRCIELVLKNGVRELEIDITNSSEEPVSPKYRLPNILLSVSMLKDLSVSGCELPSSLMVGAVKLKSLTCLRLVNIHIDDEVIKYFTTICPLLQKFTIACCHGFKNFCVYDHQNLEKVYIDCNTHLERIDIEAPNLSTLTVGDAYEREAPRMNLAICKKLTTVTYFWNHLPNSSAFTNVLSNFPFIENLRLVTYYKCNNLKWSSRYLRTLVLQSDCDLEEIEFSTPNLVLFIYGGVSAVISPVIMYHWQLLRDSTHLRGCMRCYPDRYIDKLWFQRLRNFLGKRKGLKVLNLYIHAICSQKVTDLEKLKAIELPPYELEHVELHLNTREESPLHVAFVDAVLWCCRPRSLTLSFHHAGFEVPNDFVKFTYKKLLQQEDQGNTNIQIVSTSSSLCMPTVHKGKTISFIKEEGTVETGKTVKSMQISKVLDALDIGVYQFGRTEV